jgi:2-amino-4-hydroxy-6-hydroxymethyldihydropteridine diphosphokinase
MQGLRRDPVIAFVGLGGNLGDARTTLRGAVDSLRALAIEGTLQVSSLYASAPVDSSGPDYLNAVASLHTALTAPALLSELQRIESAAGRERPYRNAPRTLDLDLLLYGSARILSPSLTVPHPRMHERAFVLLPLFELDPLLVLPAWRKAVAGQSVRRLERWT